MQHDYPIINELNDTLSRVITFQIKMLEYLSKQAGKSSTILL